jgi:hypothetical protein
MDRSGSDQGQVNTVMYLRLLQNAGNFLISSGTTTSFPRRTLLHGITSPTHICPFKGINLYPSTLYPISSLRVIPVRANTHKNSNWPADLTHYSTLTPLHPTPEKNTQADHYSHTNPLNDFLQMPVITFAPSLDNDCTQLKAQYIGCTTDLTRCLP